MIRVCILKRKRREVKVDPKFGDQWNVPNLGGQWNVPKLGGQWNVPSLVANGMKEKTPFHIFPLSLQQIYLNLQFFSFDLDVLFYHDDRLLLMPFLPFPRSINYDHAFQCNKSFTPSLLIIFCLKI